MNSKNLFLIFFASYTFVLCGQIPRVSIITSIYKAGPFIKGFMKDIVKQTIFNQCELIIINANSPDKDIEKRVIDPYLKQYSNILYFELDEDPGLYAVWNIAIRLSQGKYITNANVDDRLRHDCYQIHTNTLDDHPEYDLVYSNFFQSYRFFETFEQATQGFLDQQHKIKTREKSNVEIIVGAQSQFSLKALKRTCLPNAHPMWRKSMHDAYGYFDPYFKCIGDYEFWLRAAYKGSMFYGISNVLAVHYCNPDGLSLHDEKKMVRQAESIEIQRRYGK